MPRSMTGYGKAEAVYGKLRLEAEVKCQNHRFKDILIRLPKSLQPLEQDVKTFVTQLVNRGRVELYVYLDRGGQENGFRLEPNYTFIQAYLEITRRIKEEFQIQGDVTLEQLLREQEAILRTPEGLDPEGIRPLLFQCIQEALSQADQMKQWEGDAIAKDFEKRICKLQEILDQVSNRAMRLPLEQKKRLGERLETLLKEVPIDQGRLAMEIAIFADRCDITEEIVRARSHLGQFRALVSAQEPVGRKMEFLIQELHREITTMANKAQDVEVSKAGVEMKAELEKLREQSQNLE